MGSLYRSFLQRVDVVIRTPYLKFSFLSVFIIILLSTVLLTIKTRGSTYDYGIGDIATADIRVQKDIHYENAAETDKKRKQAEDSVLMVYDRDDAVALEKLNNTAVFFDTVENILRENPPLGTDDLTFQVFALKSKLPKYSSFSNQYLSDIFRYGNIEDLRKTANRVFMHIYDQNEAGIADRTAPQSAQGGNITIRPKNSSSDERIKPASELMSVPEARAKVPQIVRSITPQLSGKTLKALSAFISDQISPNTFANDIETRRRINEKAGSVKPVMSVLKKGQTIVREGDSITPEIMSRIQIINKNSDESHIGFIAGVFSLQIIFLFIFGFFLLESSREYIVQFRSSLIILSVMAIYMIYTFFIAGTELLYASKLNFALFLPIAFVTMIISIIYNSYLAFFVGIHIVFFTSLIGGGDYSIVTISFSSAMIGVFINSNVERRTDFLKGGFILGFLNSIVVLAVSLLDEMSYINGIRAIPLSFVNGLVNSILVMGLLPIYENLFGITTRFRLLELSDLNADIFKNMLVKAPGTYNHSIIVANMAESACKDIHANYLLARVGSYYHDIGKVERAGIFIENKITDPQAAKLSPKEYAHVIISHVRKGVELAVKNGIPDSVIDFIREHHGRGFMTYFYHQALDKATSSRKNLIVNKSEFQYPGPKPHSKETAVVMLADSVEAAARSLQEPTDLKLEALVKKIIYNKLNEGELDYSDLSMSDLTKIQKSFLRILNGIFHTRIEYPGDDEVRKLERKIKIRK